MKYFIFIATLLFLGISSSVGAEEEKAIPVKITSDIMTFSEQKKEAVFTGNVYVKHPDFQIWSEKLVGHLAAKTTAKAENPMGELEKVVALGKVKILYSNKEGFGEKVTFYTQKEMIVMEGWPRIKDGKNSLSGKIIRLYLRENRSEVVGTKHTQVEATLFTAPVKRPGRKE